MLVDGILALTLDHLALVAIAIVVAAAIAVPLGIAIAHSARLRGPALALASVLQTVPSLALFGFLIPVPFLGGIGKRTVIVALVLYALLPILRNTVSGILAVDPAVIDAATAMGLDRWQLLRMVQLPLAARAIMAGIRIATVATVGTATIAAAIGGGGLGEFIFRGVASVDSRQILAGAIPAALLALLFDGCLGWVEKRLSPPGSSA